MENLPTVVIHTKYTSEAPTDPEEIAEYEGRVYRLILVPAKQKVLGAGLFLMCGGIVSAITVAYTVNIYGLCLLIPAGAGAAVAICSGRLTRACTPCLIRRHADRLERPVRTERLVQATPPSTEVTIPIPPSKTIKRPNVTSARSDVINIRLPNGTAIPASRAALTSGSNFFQRKLANGAHELSLPATEVGEYGPEVISYLIGQPIDINDDNVEPILDVARELAVQELIDECLGFLDNSHGR